MILRVLIGLLAVGVSIGPSASYAKGKKHYHGGYEQKGKVKFFDGRCMVEQNIRSTAGMKKNGNAATDQAAVHGRHRRMRKPWRVRQETSLFIQVRASMV